MKDLISVVVPVYKVELHLRECLDCLVRQTYPFIDIILVDDGSPDRCGEICDEYAEKDERITVIHQKNQGLSSARNVALKNCKGKYVTFVDSDDLIDDDYIRYLYENIIRFNADYSFCEAQKFIDGTLPYYTYQDDQGKQISWLTNMEMWLSQKTSTGVSGKLFLRSLFAQILFPDGKLYEDLYTFYLILCNVKSIAYGNDRRYGYRMRNTSIVHAPFSEKDMDCVDMAEKLYRDVMKDHPELKVQAASRAISANMYILFRIPRGLFTREKLIIWNNIKKFRRIVAFGQSVRPKARLLALISFFGLRITRALGWKLLRLRSYNIKSHTK